MRRFLESAAHGAACLAFCAAVGGIIAASGSVPSRKGESADLCRTAPGRVDYPDSEAARRAWEEGQSPDSPGDLDPTDQVPDR